MYGERTFIVIMESGNGSQAPRKKSMLRIVRKRLNLKQAEIATILETSRTEISRIENGHIYPDWLSKAIKLNRLLTKVGMSFEDLAEETPPPQNRRN